MQKIELINSQRYAKYFLSNFQRSEFLENRIQNRKQNTTPTINALVNFG